MFYKIVFFLLLAVSFQVPLADAAVWEGPVGDPPGNNRDRPLDVSSDPQTKSGSLTLQAGLDVTNTGASNAVYGHGAGHGVVGLSTAVNTYAAIYGQNLSGGWAGYFQGPVGLSSYLTVGGAAQGGYSAVGDLYLYGKAGIAGNVLTAIGTAVAPAYSFISDINTGLYSGAADNLNFSTGGVERLKIDAAGLTTVNGQIKIIGGAPGAGKLLTSDAAGLASWVNPAAAVAGGANAQVQFNNNGAFAGDLGLTYNSGTDALTITGNINFANGLGRIFHPDDLIMESTEDVIIKFDSNNDAAGDSFMVKNHLDTTFFKVDQDGNTTMAGLVNMGWERVSTNCGNVISCVRACTAGKKIIGGGCDTAGTLRDSYPSSDSQWSCFQATNVSITAYAICARIGN